MIISTITGVIFVTLLNHNYSAKVSLILETDNSNLNFIDKNIELKIDFIKNDVMLIAHNSDLVNYATTGDNNSGNLFSNFLQDHVQSLQIYNQIKYINSSGYETIRVDYNTSSQNAVIVPKADLEDKFQRPYFNETFNLTEDNLFASTIDLTVDNGSIAHPFTPVIHFGTPVFNSTGERKGVIIVNYLVSDLLNQYNLIIKDSTNKEFFLLDHEGNYILNQNSSKQWGNILQNNISFANDNPKLWNQINISKNGSLNSDSNLVLFYTFSVFDSKYFYIGNLSYDWVALIIYKPSYLQSIHNQAIFSLVSILIQYYILFILFGFIFSYISFKRKLNDLATLQREKYQNEVINSTNLLLKQQRNELSEFAHNMNHDIHNYLTIINQYFTLIDVKNSNLDAIRNNIDKIENLLTHSLKLADSGLIIDEKKTVDIMSLINELKLSFSETIFECKAVLPKIIGDEEKIIQMLTNIIRNNITHGKATIIIIDGEYTIDRKYFMLKISNNGEGINKNVSDKLFTKGFTTSSTGNGLGLYIAQKIANSHGWYIKLTDLNFVTFSITIPVIDVDI